MTRQESFKRRIRARMEKTGEKYGAARRVLIDQASKPGRTWAAEPETSDEAVREATGRVWDEWCDIIETGPGRDSEHHEIASWLEEEHGVEGWWAQTITVGFERIAGLRLPHQQPDGTFSAGKTRTVDIDAGALRGMLFDDADRRDLFPGLDTELRSRPTSKVPRIAIGPGTAQIAIDELDDGRVRISVTHEKLRALEDVDEWKSYWSDWLDAIEEG